MVTEFTVMEFSCLWGDLGRQIKGGPSTLCSWKPGRWWVRSSKTPPG